MLPLKYAAPGQDCVFFKNSDGDTGWGCKVVQTEPNYSLISVVSSNITKDSCRYDVNILEHGTGCHFNEVFTGTSTDNGASYSGTLTESAPASCKPATFHTVVTSVISPYYFELYGDSSDDVTTSLME